MYSVIIENIREKDYFTEKIVDACLCNTVPIYWGAPNISDYFDHRGMIICSNESDIINALETITIDDYHSKLKWILKNKVNAINHANLYGSCIRNYIKIIVIVYSFVQSYAILQHFLLCSLRVFAKT